MLNTVTVYPDPSKGQITIDNPYLSNEAYMEVVQKMHVPCTDVVFYPEPGPRPEEEEKFIYLAKRSVFPMQGLWVIGGRISFNDNTFEESIARCVKTETGVAIKPERFILLSTNMYTWAQVAQGNFPGKNIAFTYMCRVSEAEIKQLSEGLTAKEYDKGFGLQKYDRLKLIAENAHPALIDLYDKMFQ